MPDARLEPEETTDVFDRLADSDKALVRVLEDLIDTLIAKNLIRFTDLPEAAQAKLMERQSLRRSVNALQIFRGEDDQPLL